MRKLFAIMAAAWLSAALQGCTEPRPSAVSSATTGSMAYERPAPIARAPLSPPMGYGSPPPAYAAPTPPAHAAPPPLGDPRPLSRTYGNSPSSGSANGSADPQAEALGWRASPRWAAIEGDGCVEVEQDGQAGGEAQGKAPRMKVETCAKQAPRDEAPAPAGTMAPPDD